jgi:hypothetical protein
MSLKHLKNNLDENVTFKIKNDISNSYNIIINTIDATTTEGTTLVRNDVGEFIFDENEQDVYFPLENIKSPFSTKTFRTITGTTSFQFVVDIKATAPINSVIFFILIIFS